MCALPEQPRAIESQKSSRTCRDRRNWGRWGADDQVGAMNLITAPKRASAAALVPDPVRTVSLSREFPKFSGAEQPHARRSISSKR